MLRKIAALLIACAAFAMSASASTDQDTVCASVYALLSENARNTGLDSNAFEAGLNTAQSYHLAANPTDDPQRYALTVIDSAQVIRDALAQGKLTSRTILDTATSCNTRYSSNH